MESFNLNIIPGKDRPVCHASQFDIGRQFHVNLFEGFNVFTLDGTETISLSVRKPDGNVVTASVTNTSDSYVEFVTTEQMTACEGSNLCELKLEKGSDVIGTANFILEVEVDPLEGGIQSASEIDNLQTQVAGMVAAEVADQYDSANVIFDAAPTAGHGVGYAVTSEGIKNEFDALPQIDDNSTSATGLWSSDKIDTELSAKQDATDANLQTTDQTIVGAINELNSDKANVSFVSAWEDITNTITPSTNVENVLYLINRATGLKYISFSIKPAVSDDAVLISNMSNIQNAFSQPLPLATTNWESIQLGIFSAYYYGTENNIRFRCKTPTSTVKLIVAGFLL